MNKPIGVFDSGIGGLTILKELATNLPFEDFIYFADCKNAPYGYKSVEEIQELADRIIDFLVKKDCKLIVIACNTATAAAVQHIREEYDDIPIVGLEPAVKPACLNSKTGNIGVLATEGTFRGNHFKNTSEKYKNYVTIHLQIAKGLVELAENGKFYGSEVESIVKQYTEPFAGKNIDYLVLGCTHYPFFYDSICKSLGDSIKVIDSAKPVATRTKDLLMVNNLLATENPNRRIKIFSSGNLDVLNKTVSCFLNQFDNIEISEQYNI